jgi:RNA polymerase sigma-70 factor (ECF subfamily)
MSDSAALDQADMQRLAAGEERALDGLMERHAAGVTQFLFRMLGNADEAEDLAQEAFVRVFQHRGRFRPGARFSTWLYTIAANLARNRMRWRSRHPTASLDAPAASGEGSLGQVLSHAGPTPAQRLESEERVAAVRGAVAGLPEDLREALVLCEWEDLSVAEAASVLGATPKAVESRLYRARKQLREALGRWLG